RGCPLSGAGRPGAAQGAGAAALDAGTAPVAGARGAAARAGPAAAGPERMAGSVRCSAAGRSGAVADALSGQGQPPQPFRQPRPAVDPADAAALAVAATSRRA